MIVKVHIDRADVEVIDKAAKSDGRSRSSYIARAAVLAAAEQAPSPKVERSCFTCRWISDPPSDGCRYPCASGTVSAKEITAYELAAGFDDDGMPTNRTIDCPGWAAKEQG